MSKKTLMYLLGAAALYWLWKQHQTSVAAPAALPAPGATATQGAPSIATAA